MYRLFAVVEFPRKGKAKKIFRLLNAIRDNNVDPLAGGSQILGNTRPTGKHRIEVLVGSSLTRDHELAQTKDILSAVEKHGATVEYL